MRMSRTQLDLRMNPCARRLRVGLPKLPRRPRSPPWWRPAWVVVIGLQLISARSGQPRPWRLLLRLRSCIVVTRARWRLLRVRASAGTMSRLRVASTIPTVSCHLICVIGSRVRLGTDLTRVAKKVEEGILNTRRDSSSELKRRSAVGQGK